MKDAEPFAPLREVVPFACHVPPKLWYNVMFARLPDVMLAEQLNTTLDRLIELLLSAGEFKAVKGMEVYPIVTLYISGA